MDRKRTIIEATWVVAIVLLSVLLMGLVLGFDVFFQKVLDIQLHDTYFVFPPLLLLVLLAVTIAFVIYGARFLFSFLRRLRA